MTSRARQILRDLPRDGAWAPIFAVGQMESASKALGLLELRKAGLIETERGNVRLTQLGLQFTARAA